LLTASYLYFGAVQLCRSAADASCLCPEKLAEESRGVGLLSDVCLQRVRDRDYANMVS
jgi:hypothetical protein